MPQMSPMYWLMLFIYFIFFLLFILMLIYYIFNMNLSTNIMNTTQLEMNWLW